MIALAVAIAAIYAQVTVNDIILARYTADAWRGRVYAVRYFTLFISAAIAIAMISLLHNSGGFGLVLGGNSIIALAMFLATLGLVSLIVNIEVRHASRAAGRIDGSDWRGRGYFAGADSLSHASFGASVPATE